LPRAFWLKMPISSFSCKKSRDEVYWGKCRQFNFLQKVQEKLSVGHVVIEIYEKKLFSTEIAGQCVRREVMPSHNCCWWMMMNFKHVLGWTGKPQKNIIYNKIKSKKKKCGFSGAETWSVRRFLGSKVPISLPPLLFLRNRCGWSVLGTCGEYFNSSKNKQEIKVMGLLFIWVDTIEKSIVQYLQIQKKKKNIWGRAAFWVKNADIFLSLLFFCQKLAWWRYWGKCRPI